MESTKQKLPDGTEPGAAAGDLPKRRARVHTRAALIDAAEDLFAEHGTPSASIDEICTRAGFTRGAFYSNFRTVDDVFFALYERKTEDLSHRMLNFGRSLAGAEESAQLRPGALEDFVDALLDVIPADRQWYALRALYGLRGASDPELSQVLREHGDEFQRGFTALLTQVARTVGEELLPTPQAAAQIVTAAHVGAVLQGSFVDEPASLRRNAVLAALRGVLSRSGSAPARPRQE
ncbi:TetR/AcrR family transcriptional regulator [Leucobacter komagatae]|uniref:TetR/AcrR family transcriptional regulator n=1 Tax=Leucobacter komagatae TaxID=55969 RepID=UPI000696303D|nr:TetR/AcrR family transcriptional regulator [Leucobacter komagatae]